MRRTLDHHFDYFCLVILLILCYVLFFHQLGGIGFVGPDEPRYASVARGMFESGDYLTPRLLGEPWFEKPVLMYWLAAIGFALIGVGETAARLPSAVAATLSTLALFWCGRRLYSRGTGFAAALILATSAGFIGLSRAASMDMLLSTSLTLALVFFLVGANTEGPSRSRYFYLFYAALGVGVLAKGPVAVLLPVLALAIFLIWRGGAGEWRTWHPEGFAFTALVAGPWYVAVTVANGGAFIDEFLIGHNFERFTMDAFGHVQPFYFFIPVFLLMMFPWTFLLIPAITRRLDKNEHLLVVWAAVPFVFFSFSGSKLPAYILPMAAPLALLLAGEITKHEASVRFRIATLVEAGLWLGLGVVAAFFSDLISVEVPVGGGTGVLGVMLAIALGLVAIAFLFPPPALGLYNAVTVVGLVLVVTGLLFPSAQAIESVRPWIEEGGSAVSGAEDMLLYKPPRWMEYGLEYYLDRPARSVESEEQLLELTESGERFFCLSETSSLDELSASDRIAIEVVEARGAQTAFWVWQP
jgi:4-amino-4-deoxy-L-arabinose transferase-like glycosyltransferase